VSSHQCRGKRRLGLRALILTPHLCPPPLPFTPSPWVTPAGDPVRPCVQSRRQNPGCYVFAKLSQPRLIPRAPHTFHPPGPTHLPPKITTPATSHPTSLPTPHVTVKVQGTALETCHINTTPLLALPSTSPVPFASGHLLGPSGPADTPLHLFLLSARFLTL
jgi:hypothetical protein